MASTTRRTCQGKRRMWRRHVLGEFKCGRKATVVLTTNVGLSRTHYACDDPECYASLTHGYGADVREL